MKDATGEMVPAGNLFTGVQIVWDESNLLAEGSASTLGIAPSSYVLSENRTTAFVGPAVLVVCLPVSSRLSVRDGFGSDVSRAHGSLSVTACSLPRDGAMDRAIDLLRDEVS